MNEFIKAYNDTLEEKGFDENQKKLAVEALIFTNETQTSTNPQNDALLSIASKLVDNPSFVNGLFKPNKWKMIYDFFIALLLLVHWSFSHGNRFLGLVKLRRFLGGL